MAGRLRERYDDWRTDRIARRPSGRKARKSYADPTCHYPAFGVILAELRLTADDVLLEVGCGGGALLRVALESGCRAKAVDHSPEMVRLARKQNAAAIADGRLEVVETDAASLPFADETCTAAALANVVGFLPDPVAAFAEIRRVLRPGGRFVALGAPPEWKGTMAAPEPVASRLSFYTDEELGRLGREAGFEEARVERIDLGPHAPEEVAEFFTGEAAPFLIARKK
jgi:SAM-dependent methyltransferase